MIAQLLNSQLLVLGVSAPSNMPQSPQKPITSRNSTISTQSSARQPTMRGCWTTTDIPMLAEIVVAVRASMAAASRDFSADSPLVMALDSHAHVPVYGVGIGNGGVILSALACTVELNGLLLIGAGVDASVLPWIRPGGMVANVTPWSASVNAALGTTAVSEDHAQRYPPVAFTGFGADSHLVHMVNVSMATLSQHGVQALTVLNCARQPFNASTCAALLPQFTPFGCQFIQNRLTRDGFLHAAGTIHVDARGAVWNSELNTLVTSFRTWLTPDASPTLDPDSQNRIIALCNGGDDVSVSLMGGEVSLMPTMPTDELAGFVTRCVRTVVRSALSQLFGESISTCSVGIIEAVKFLSVSALRQSS